MTTRRNIRNHMAGRTAMHGFSDSGFDRAAYRGYVRGETESVENQAIERVDDVMSDEEIKYWAAVNDEWIEEQEEKEAELQYWTEVNEAWLREQRQN